MTIHKSATITAVMQRVPRYTSYPTAPNFHDGIDASVYQKWLRDLSTQQKNLSLYFHIPYCKQLGWFCGCHTKIINHYTPVSRYMELLRREIELISPYVKHMPVEHIHFGGGSPTILAADDFAAFMQFLQNNFSFSNSPEIAVEMDPRTLTADKVQSYAISGVNRASLGVQDFNHKVQQAINREQPYELVVQCIEMLRQNNINAINIDLIYGLPHQTLDSVRKTIELTLSLKPNRISLFGYAHVPWMKKHQQLVPEDALPSVTARAEMADAAREQLVTSGYIPVGLDHFAQQNDSLAQAAFTKTVKRNFQGYTTDYADILLGFGVSSISSLPQGYLQNTASNIEYALAIEANILPIQRGIELTQEDKQRREIIMSLMCNLQANICENQYKDELRNIQQYINTGAAQYKNGILTISPQAVKQLRLIASAFDSYIPKTSHQYSQAI